MSAADFWSCMTPVRNIVLVLRVFDWSLLFQFEATGLLDHGSMTLVNVIFKYIICGLLLLEILRSDVATYSSTVHLPVWPSPSAKFDIQATLI
jgi:hypothetical protein